MFGVFSEHALIVLNFFGFDEGYYPFCSGVIFVSAMCFCSNATVCLPVGVVLTVDGVVCASFAAVLLALCETPNARAARAS